MGGTKTSKKCGGGKTPDLGAGHVEKLFCCKIGVNGNICFHIGYDDDARDVIHNTIEKQFPPFDTLLGVPTIRDVSQSSVVAEEHV